MPRKRTFDEDEILNRVVRRFWEHGFDGTSMKDLTQATGLSNGSLYNGFGDKESIFLKAISHYETTVIDPRIANFLRADNVRAGLEAYFREATESGRSGAFLGCLIVNAHVDGRQRSQKVQDKIAAIQRKVDMALSAALQRAQRSGIIDAKKDTPALASRINLIMSGILLRGRLDPDADQRRDAVGLIWAEIEEKV